jgi:hypothetical protein
MAKDAGKLAFCQFLGKEREVISGMGLPKPTHIIFDENLDAFAINTASALKGPPNSASGGHVRPEFHRGFQ